MWFWLATTIAAGTPMSHTGRRDAEDQGGFSGIRPGYLRLNASTYEAARYQEVVERHREVVVVAGCRVRGDHRNEVSPKVSPRELLPFQHRYTQAKGAPLPRSVEHQLTVSTGRRRLIAGVDGDRQRWP